MLKDHGRTIEKWNLDETVYEHRTLLNCQKSWADSWGSICHVTGAVFSLLCFFYHVIFCVVKILTRNLSDDFIIYEMLHSGAIHLDFWIWKTSWYPSFGHTFTFISFTAVLWLPALLYIVSRVGVTVCSGAATPQFKG